MDSRKLYKRFQNAKGNWENWRSLYEEAYAFSIPNRNPWPQRPAEGQRKNLQCYDITAVTALRRLVSRLQGSLMPQGEQWFGLEAGDAVVDEEEKKVLNTYLQDFTDIIFQSLNDSNFSLVIAEVLQDLCIGTGALMIVPSNDPQSPLKFKAAPVDYIYPEGNQYDEIKSVWREFINVKVVEIKEMWPKAKLSQALEDRLKQDPLCTACVVEGVVYDMDKRDYRIVVMESSSNEFMLDKRSPSSPWVVARWGKASNEVGGRGPVIEALPTIRSLNTLVEEILRNAALATSPPWLAASDGVFNPYLFEIVPNKVIPISRQSMGELPLSRLDVSSDINTGSLEVNDLRQMVKDALFDNPVRPVTAPEQTATEIMIRQQQFADEIGPAFGRLTVELTPPVINRVIYILQRKGLLPPDLNVDGRQVQIRYKSPLVKHASVQKVHNLQNYAQIMGSIMGQELAMGTLQLDQLPEWLSDKLDVDEKLVKSPLEVRKLIQQAMQAAQPQDPGASIPSANSEAASSANADQAGI